MTRWWSTASIRLRLTVWYVTVLTLMLIVYASATYVAVRHEFYEELDQGAAIRAGSTPPNGEARVEQQLDEILMVLVLGLPLIVALAGIGGYVLARRALAPIDRLAWDARRITAERLHERLSVPNEHDEIGRLATVINETFASLESSFDQLRRFTEDASHELRTPLSVIRGVGELGLGETRTPAQYREMLGSMLEEVGRLTGLVDTLLRLSRGDAGMVRLSRESIDLTELTRDVAASMAILADERRQRLQVHADAAMPLFVDRLVIRDAIANVIDNAIKYGPTGSDIDVTVDGDDDRVVLTVEDQGPGVPAEHRARIFDRFYRVDEGRSREMGGAGLGLAIAKWAVEAHGGTIALVSDGRRGATFQVALPRTGAPERIHVTQDSARPHQTL